MVQLTPQLINCFGHLATYYFMITNLHFACLYMKSSIDVIIPCILNCPCKEDDIITFNAPGKV